MKHMILDRSPYSISTEYFAQFEFYAKCLHGMISACISPLYS